MHNRLGCSVFLRIAGEALGLCMYIVERWTVSNATATGSEGDFLLILEVLKLILVKLARFQLPACTMS